MKNCFSVALVLVGLSGCAAYRTDSSVESTVAAPTAASTRVVISENALPGRKFKEMGPVEVSVKKLTIFHKDPTKEQANEALMESARALGADGVINVKYESGIGFTTWGYMDAKGTAIKFTD